MTEDKKSLLLKFKYDLEKFNHTRKVWLYLSSIVFIGIVSIIIAWPFLKAFDSLSLWWAIGSTGLTITAVWWYWTMRLIRKILHHQSQMIEILAEITYDIQEIKIEVFEIFKK